MEGGRFRSSVLGSVYGRIFRPSPGHPCLVFGPRIFFGVYPPGIFVASVCPRAHLGNTLVVVSPTLDLIATSPVSNEYPSVIGRRQSLALGWLNRSFPLPLISMIFSLSRQYCHSHWSLDPRSLAGAGEKIPSEEKNNFSAPTIPRLVQWWIDSENLSCLPFSTLQRDLAPPGAQTASRPQGGC